MTGPPANREVRLGAGGCQRPVEGHLQLDPALRGHHRTTEHALLAHLTVDQELPLPPQPRQVGEPLPVPHPHPPAGQVGGLDHDRAVDPGHLAQRGVGRAVRTDEAVGNDVGVVLSFGLTF